LANFHRGVWWVFLTGRAKRSRLNQNKPRVRGRQGKRYLQGKKNLMGKTTIVYAKWKNNEKSKEICGSGGEPPRRG